MSSRSGAPRRVLLVVSTLDGAGPGRVMSILGRELTARGFDATLVATHGPRESPLIAETEHGGVPVVHLGMRAMGDPSGAGRFLRLLRRLRPDVVHTRTIRADLLGRLAAPRGIPVVNNIVNVYPDDCLVRLGPVVGRAVMTLSRLTRGAARLFVANARAVADNTREAFGVTPERVQVVYDGLLLDRWARASPADLSAHGITTSDRVCLAVSRLHPQKGLDDLVAAAAMVTAARPEARFVVAGEGPERRRLETYARSAGLGDRFVLLGNRSDVPELMARADLFVLPSRFEGLPSAIIEAMGAGRAVVACATAGVPELVEDGVTGWLVPVGRPDALAGRLLDALGEDLLLIGEAGRRRARARFSADAMATGFSQAYEAAALG
jgi:glycosyltransferase involved in cell wall biosynthesis